MHVEILLIPLLSFGFYISVFQILEIQLDLCDFKKHFLNWQSCYTPSR